MTTELTIDVGLKERLEIVSKHEILNTRLEQHGVLFGFQGITAKIKESFSGQNIPPLFLSA